MTALAPGAADVVRSGSGPVVLLIHSSGGGARQWRKLAEALSDRYEVRAVNLRGYGATPAWDEPPGSKTWADEAAVAADAVADVQGPLRVVGHSIGGAVAVMFALGTAKTIERLAVFEPVLFHLLRDNGLEAMWAETQDVTDRMQDHARAGRDAEAARALIDYWAGSGAFDAIPPERRDAQVALCRPVAHDWDMPHNETTTLAETVAGLPARTLVMSSADTRRTAHAIVDLLRRAAPPSWRFEELPEGGHLAPITRPDVVNPIIEAFLDAP